MAIRTLKKVTLFGPAIKKREVLFELQDLGVMHIIPLSDSEDKLRARPHDYYEALKYLATAPETRTAVKRVDEYDTETIVQDVLRVQADVRQTQNERDKLEEYISSLENWGDFDFPTTEQLNGRQLFFYKVPGFKRKKLANLKGITFQEVYSGNRNAYIVVIAEEKPAKGVIPGEFVDIGPMSLSDAKDKFEQLTMKLEDLRDERQRLTRWTQLLLRDLHKIEDKTVFEYVADRTLDDEHFFAVQGWVAEDDLAMIEQLVDLEEDLAIHVDNPAKDDRPPTFFENPDSTAPGEDLVKFYQMPAYAAFDPSAILYFSFAIFFAMIMSDAGYGACIGLLTLIFWKKMGSSEAGKRVRRICLMLTGASIVYGVLVGSYFGVSPSGGILNKFSVLDVNNFDMMMKVSILVGVAHLVLANLVLLWKHRRELIALSFLGWIAIFGGATGLWLVGTDSLICQASMIAGGIAVLLFTSRRPFNSAKNIALRFFDGLLGVANLSKAFGDTLSYLRLFALGLASASLAVMFNKLAGDVAENIAGIGTFLSFVVLILGHSLNFVLAIMGGVVHGLRLNLIEFFSWSLSDEGYEFKPFKRKEKQLWNK